VIGSEVHVWRASLSGVEPVGVAADEVARGSHLRSPLARHRFLAGRSVLRALLGWYSGVSAAALTFDLSPLGKPCLRDGSLRFSVSHAGDAFLCAIAFEHEVGVDVEDLSSLGDPRVVMDAALSAREREWVGGLDDGVVREAVLRCWVRKEAVSKGLGEGLNLPFGTVLSPCSLTASAARVPIEGRRKERWFVWDVPMPPGWVAAVAAPRRRIRIRVFDWFEEHGQAPGGLPGEPGSQARPGRCP